MTRITLPEKMDLESVLAFAGKLDAVKPAGFLTIDMGPKRHFSPFAMLFLVAKILEFKNKSSNTELKLENVENHSYPAHMGFFRAIGFEYGKDIGEAKGSAQYAPIRALHKADLFEIEGGKFMELGDVVQKHADGIAQMITRDDTHKSDIFDVLSYSIREIVRNVFEHSHCDRVLYCAQYWPTNGKVEVSLVDQGIGIRQSLSTNPNFRYQTDKEALEMSLLPGVSGKTHLPMPESPWKNSGYGLYMTSRLARHGGNFVITSGNAAVGLSKKSKRNYATNFRGTAVRMSFNTREIGNVAKRLTEFRRDAQKIGTKHLRVSSRNPSYMSMLLRRDYEM